jgi:hypothetical protein
MLCDPDGKGHPMLDQVSTLLKGLQDTVFACVVLFAKISAKDFVSFPAGLL